MPIANPKPPADIEQIFHPKSGAEVPKHAGPKGLPAPSLLAVDNSVPDAMSLGDLFGIETPRGSGRDPRKSVVVLSDVLESVDVHFPALLAAQTEIEAAEGALLAASGNFDTTLRASLKNELRGSYQKDIVDLLIEQPTAVWGTSFYAGYRWGAGDFADYERGLKTNQGGEVRLGLKLPLLQGREIDDARFEVWKAEAKRAAADPAIQEKRVSFMMKATHAYWKWVAAGQEVVIADDLLRLARDRRRSLSDGVLDGLFAEIILTENDQLVVVRESARIVAAREFERAAIGLSLYLRDALGEPLRTTLAEVPEDFPARSPVDVDHDRLISFGLNNRPEARYLVNELKLARLELKLRENTLLPKLDASVFTSRDIGGAVSVPDDKGPLELGVGLTFELPLGRRQARGHVMASRAEVDRLTYETRFLEDKIDQDIRDALSAVDRLAQRIDLAERSLDLAMQLEEAERVKLEEGVSDLVVLNLREQSTAKSRADVVDVQAEYFSALATLRAALGLPHADS